MSLQDMGDNCSPQFIICKLQWLLGKDTKVVSCCLLHSFGFKIVLIVDWLLHKTEEPCLPYNFIHNCEWKKSIHAFPKCISTNINATDSDRTWTWLPGSTFCTNNSCCLCIKSGFVFKWSGTDKNNSHNTFC